MKTLTRLKEIIEQHGIENLRFLVSMKPIRSFAFFNYTTSRDKEENVLCKIVEERYKLKDNHKIELRAESNLFGKESFYISDLEQLIVNKTIRIFIEITEE